MSRSVWGRQESLPEKASYELKNVEFSRKSVLNRGFSWTKAQRRRDLESSRNLEWFDFYVS